MARKVERADFDFVIEDSHFEYLALQKGSLSHLVKPHTKSVSHHGDWLAAYKTRIFDDYDSIRPHLPEKCRRILDIGSGLGGVDAVLTRHYGDVRCTFLDGESDPPVMRRHAQTFNDCRVAADFLNKNGVKSSYHLSPKWADDPTIGSRLARHQLIISLGSWCFHYPPETYLALVDAMRDPDAIMIVDVRKDKPKWLDTLRSTWSAKSIIHVSRKADRYVFCAR